MQDRMPGAMGFTTGSWPLDVNRTTLIFIHGAANNRHFWQNQIDDLNDIANTIAIDLPGHGLSTNGASKSIDDYAQAVLNFIQELNIPNPIPCGLSMGGAIAQQLLLDHNEFFNAGIFINTGSRLKVSPFILETILKNYDKFLDSILVMGISNKSDAEALKPIIQEMSHCDPQVAHRDFLACNRFDVRDRLHDIVKPVLVLTAEDDLLTPPKFGQFLADNIPGAKCKNIKDAGHLAPLEKPDDINRVIRAFLKSNGW